MAVNIHNTSFADRQEALRRWDEIPGMVERQDTSARIPDPLVTKAIVDALDYSVNMDFSDLPPITEDDPTYVAVKRWLGSGRSMGVHYYSMESARAWLDAWLEHSRNR